MHVACERAWRKNLARIRADSDIKAIVYKTVRLLMEVADEEEFSAKMKEFLTVAVDDSKTSDFGQ